MITIRVKTINERTQEQDFCTTKINCSFLEAKKYFLHENQYSTDLNFLKMEESVWKKISIELVEV